MTAVDTNIVVGGIQTFNLALRTATLVLQYRVTGMKVHDARIGAASIVHRVPKILTFDVIY